MAFSLYLLSAERHTAIQAVKSTSVNHTECVVHLARSNGNTIITIVYPSIPPRITPIPIIVNRAICIVRVCIRLFAYGLLLRFRCCAFRLKEIDALNRREPKVGIFVLSIFRFHYGTCRDIENHMVFVRAHHGLQRL